MSSPEEFQTMLQSQKELDFHFIEWMMYTLMGKLESRISVPVTFEMPEENDFDDRTYYVHICRDDKLRSREITKLSVGIYIISIIKEMYT